MAIAEDASTPAVASSTAANTTAITTAAFSPPANSLIVAIVALGNGAGSGTVTGTVTWATGGGGASWTAKIRTNTTANAAAEVWISQIGGSAPGSSTVQLAVGGTSTTQYGKLLAVRVLTGAHATQNGATVSSTASDQPNITPTQIGSYIAAAFASNVQNYTMTANGNTTTISTVSDAGNGETYTSGKSAALTTSTSAIAIGWTTTVTNPNTALLEVVPAAAASAAGPIYTLSQYGSFR